MKDRYRDVRVPIAKDNVSICRNEKLCIKCGACKNVCKFNVGVYGNYDLDKEILCVNCGQCSLACPTSSIGEVMDYKKVIKCIKKNKVVIFQIAPAVRASLCEEFGMELGTNTVGKIVTALRKLGASYVFDTTFGADLTVMEEANEFIDRINNKKMLPMFTSCCPAWVKYVETFYPEFISNLSSCKSPIMMEGAIIKSYFANIKSINKKDIVSVAITPCTAKKWEIKREEFNSDVDYVITTRELAKWLKEEKIDFVNLEDGSFDSIMGNGTGAGVIFGNSGGVTEAVMRTASHTLTGKDDVITLDNVRGLGNIKETVIKIGDSEFKVCVINGTGDAKKILDKMKTGEVYYDLIEVMACEGGCIAGGGQPKVYFPVTGEVKIKRKDCLFDLDCKSLIRNSYDNPDIKKIYDEFLSKSFNSKMLHTSFVKRKK